MSGHCSSSYDSREGSEAAQPPCPAHQPMAPTASAAQDQTAAPTSSAANQTRRPASPDRTRYVADTPAPSHPRAAQVTLSIGEHLVEVCLIQPMLLARARSMLVEYLPRDVQHRRLFATAQQEVRDQIESSYAPVTPVMFRRPHPLCRRERTGREETHVAFKQALYRKHHAGAAPPPPAAPADFAPTGSVRTKGAPAGGAPSAGEQPKHAGP